MIGQEYRTSNAQIAFPFKEDASGLARTVDPVHGASATLPEDFFIDALFVVPDDIEAVYLNRITEDGGTLYTFYYWDHLGNEIMSMELDTSTMSGTYHLIATGTDEDEEYAGKAVLNVEAVEDYLAGLSVVDMFETTLPFERSTAEVRKPKVLSFRLVNGDVVTPAEGEPPISTDVKIESGYNTVTTLAEETDIDTSEVTLTITPGAGIGRAPCQVEDLPSPPIHMSLRPDNAGNINLKTGDEDCYNIVPILELNTMEIQGVCQACCSCEDYTNMLEALRLRLAEAKAVYCRLRYAHDGPGAQGTETCTEPPEPTEDTSYTRGVVYFNTTVREIFGKPTVKLNGAPGSKGTSLGGQKFNRHTWAKFIAAIRNLSNVDVTITAYEFNFTEPGGEVHHTVWERNWDPPHEVPECEYPSVTSPVGEIIQKGRTMQVMHECEAAWQAEYYDSYKANVRVVLQEVGGSQTWEITDEVELKSV